MKKTKLLAPILTIGTLGAIATPMTILTSCSSKNTGADANLVNDYVCEVSPASEVTYDSVDDALNAYVGAMKQATNSNNSNSDDYKILKDDARFSYAKAFATDQFKTVGSLTSYTLDFTDVSFPTNKTLSVNFNITAKGGYKFSEQVQMTDADFTMSFQLEKPFNLYFREANETYTKEKINYIICELPLETTGECWVNYTLGGTCKLGGETYTIEKKSRRYDVMSGLYFTSEQKYGYVAKELILTGLSCNMKSYEIPYSGVLYSNYMSKAKIKAA